MRLVIFFVLGIICSAKIKAQGDTIFFNKKWERVGKDSAVYFRLPFTKTQDGKYLIEDYYVSTNKLYSLGTYIDSNADIGDGQIAYYHENGKIESIGKEKMGVANGEWRTYYDDGKSLHWKQNWEEGAFHGYIFRYYKSGQIERKELYKQGDLKTKQCFSRLGLDTPYHVAQCCPVFPGGWKAFYKYIKRNKKYPKEWKKAKLKGVVYVRVYFDTLGKSYHVQFIKRAHPLLDEEAKRILLAMPAHGSAYELEKNDPVEFTRKYEIIFP